MYPCLTQVRRLVETSVRNLFHNIDDLRIAVIAHGDYCDGPETYRVLDFTNQKEHVMDFIRNAPPTSGGDADECYELVLQVARTLDWTAGKEKSMVLIGDSCPHSPGYRKEGSRFGNKGGDTVVIDWHNEARLLNEMGVKLYPLQAMGRGRSDTFYDQLSRIFGTPKLELPQFTDVSDILMAVAYHNAGQLDDFENQLRSRPEKPSFHVWRTLDQLAGRKVDLSRRSVKIGSRFQVLDVDENCDIKGFVEKNGLYFQKGRGFYELTKTETIQEYKEVVAQNRETGAIITGKRARSVLGIGEETGRYKTECDTHNGFVQSTSVNRKLIGGTRFLYEVAELDGLSA
jgi:hypothetical protein